MTRFYEAELRVVGMNAPQFELMANLQGRPRACQSELAEAMDVDQTTLSRNLKLLIDQGWVRAVPSARDGRRAEYEQSAKGRRVFLQAIPCWERAMNRIEEQLGPQANLVWQVLERLSAAAEAV